MKKTRYIYIYSRNIEGEYNINKLKFLIIYANN